LRALLAARYVPGRMHGRMTVGRSWWGVVAVLAALALPASAGAADGIYWSTGFGSNQIARANLDGSGGGSALSLAGTATPFGLVQLAADVAHNRVYAASGGNSRIIRANLDGTGSSENLTFTGAVPSTPSALAVAPSTGTLYWGNAGNLKLGSAPLDGGAATLFDTTGSTVGAPDFMAIYPPANLMLWTMSTNRIGRARLDGTGGLPDLNTTGATVNGPEGIAVDAVAGRVYWVNNAGGPTDGSIYWAALDGSGGGVFNVPAVGSVGLAIDRSTNHIYWTSLTGGGEVWRANLDGTGAAPLSTAGAPVNPPLGLMIVKAPSAAGVPAITGATTVGGTLSCDTGTWGADEPWAQLYRVPSSFSWQWSRDGTPIGGATRPTLVTSAAGDYRCTVTATNVSGSTPQVSAPVSVTPPPFLAPVVGGLSPDSGTAGTSVTITGTHFGGTAQVLFGDQPADFAVMGFDRIVALAPPHAPGEVPVTVVAGATSRPSAASTFRYEVVPSLTPPNIAPSLPTRAAKSCVVPHLLGRTRAGAAARLTAAHCRLGRVTGSRSRRAKVVAQRPRAGTRRAHGARVAIRLR
jgi:hypothetical protein